MCLRFKKKSVLKRLDRTVYFFSFIATGRLYVRCHRTPHSASDFECGGGVVRGGIPFFDVQKIGTRTRWAGHIARKEETSNSHTMTVGKS